MAKPLYKTPFGEINKPKTLKNRTREPFFGHRLGFSANRTGAVEKVEPKNEPVYDIENRKTRFSPQKSIWGENRDIIHGKQTINRTQHRFQVKTVPTGIDDRDTGSVNEIDIDKTRLLLKTAILEMLEFEKSYFQYIR